MSSAHRSNDCHNGGDESGCGRHCLSRCCLRQGTRLPLYCFSKVGKVEPQANFLESLFKQWDDRKVKGLLHHDTNACGTKSIPGRYGFIAHLIEGRDLKKRPTEFRIDEVLQPFDENKFNFTKIGQEEVLFRFQESDNGNASVITSESPNVIAINVSPIGYGHVLLIPCVLDCLPQRINKESFFLAMSMAKEANTPYFRVGYNSLGAFATINHLHFQAFYLAETFAVEKAPIQTIATLKTGVKICRLVDYPVRGLLFAGGSNFKDLSDTVSAACIFLQDSGIPYNVLISDSGGRIFLLLQCFAEKRSRGEVSQEIVETQMNPAAWELSGYLVMKRRKDFEEASEDTVLSFLNQTSVSASIFGGISESILEALCDGFQP
ncbi:GDP-L-galactose phosphorylase 2-like isoform X1 [Zingiber officinale]|uniref:GDP-L-galactose phosphorylase 2-like isoform X1 n=1 Tax=Zingiber officinale TaxID=94328 RepID=UPI001C4A913A|nr:GDP-L-galactose phosphorylase 2-like isoform X1 [Zingiber officinale]